MVNGRDQVLLDRPGPDRVRLRARQHVEVVRGIGKVLARLHGIQALPEAVQRRQEGGHGGRCRDGVGAALFRVDVVHRPEPLGGTEQGQRRTQPGERSGAARGGGHGWQRGPHLVGQPPQRRGPRSEGDPLLRVRQVTMDHQMPDVLETAGLREFDCRVLAVVIEALQPSDVTQ